MALVQSEEAFDAVRLEESPQRLPMEVLDLIRLHLDAEAEELLMGREGARRIGLGLRSGVLDLVMSATKGGPNIDEAVTIDIWSKALDLCGRHSRSSCRCLEALK